MQRAQLTHLYHLQRENILLTCEWPLLWHQVERGIKMK